MFAVRMQIGKLAIAQLLVVRTAASKNLPKSESQNSQPEFCAALGTGGPIPWDRLSDACVNQ